MYKNRNISNKKYRTVDGVKIQTYETEFSSYYNSVVAEAGTTGYVGGSAKKGGRTFFKLLGLDGTNLKVQRDANGDGFTLKAGGDVELDLLIDALEYIVDILKKERDSSERKMRSESYKSVSNKNYNKKYNKKYNKDESSDEEVHVINANAMATDKQIEYIKVLAIRHRYELNTHEIKRKDADELINILKQRGTVHIPNKFVEYFNYKPEKWEEL